MTELQALGLKPIEWRDSTLLLLDQRALPVHERFLPMTTAVEVAQAITDMVVRGAPAIGIAAAYAVVLSFAQHRADFVAMEPDVALLAASRPTAVNLHHALQRMTNVWQRLKAQDLDFIQMQLGLLHEAQAIHREDLQSNQAMAAIGTEHLRKSFEAFGALGVLTHCNTGSLATGGLGTALGIIKHAARQGLVNSIYATETRPWLQGSRLTAFELQYEGFDVQLLVEGGAASLMASGAVQWLIVGADRITANGDVANKVGTLGLAVLAQHYGVKVMVAAPLTTVDFTLQSSSDIPIEYRGGAEILAAAGYEKADAVPVYNPVFDVTPAALIDVIVTEQGACAPQKLSGRVLSD